MPSASIQDGPAASLGTLVASSATFQEWTGATTVDAAREFIHYAVVEKLDQDTPLERYARPFALVGFSSFTTAWATRGELFLLFEAEYANNDVYTVGDRYTTFARWVGTIIDEIWQLGQDPGYLVIPREAGIEAIRPPTGAGRQDPELVFSQWFRVQYGLRAG